MTTASTAFRDHDLDTAPPASRAFLRATQAQLGFIPAAMARLAEAPTVLDAFARLQQIWDGASLGLLEREVVTFEVAHDNGCELCVAFHSAMLSRADQPALLAALRARRPLDDPRLEALRRFTRAVLDARGAVDDDALAAFRAAGFDNRQALDVVLGIATYTLSTYANRLVRAPVDPPLAAFAPDR